MLNEENKFKWLIKALELASNEHMDRFGELDLDVLFDRAFTIYSKAIESGYFSARMKTETKKTIKPKKTTEAVGMKISELAKNEKVVNLVATVKKLETPDVTPNGAKFQEGYISDGTDEVKITFWGDEVNKFKEGDKIIIATGWCKEFKDELQVSSGKFGKINLVPE